MSGDGSHENTPNHDRNRCKCCRERHEQQQAIRKILPPGTLVWVMRNGTRQYQEMVLDSLVLPGGILVVSTVTFTIQPPKRQRIRAYLSVTGALTRGEAEPILQPITSLAELPTTYRSYYHAPQPPRSGTTLSFQDVVVKTTTTNK